MECSKSTSLEGNLCLHYRFPQRPRSTLGVNCIKCWSNPSDTGMERTRAYDKRRPQLQSEFHERNKRMLNLTSLFNFFMSAIMRGVA